MQQDRFENGGDYVNAYGMHYLMKALKIEFPFLKEAESTSLEYTSMIWMTHLPVFSRNKIITLASNHVNTQRILASRNASTNIMVVDTHYLKLPKLGLVKFFWWTSHPR